mgnify:CR=1 FL=1
MLNSLVLGGGGFIGNHLVNYLKDLGKNVIAVDLKNPEFTNTNADDFILGDLTRSDFTDDILNGQYKFDEIYQLAADMGGAEFIFSGDNDADVMTNSGLINLNVLRSLKKNLEKTSSNPKIFYSSSACIYPEEKQLNENNVSLKEDDAYPANPDSEYGWEKLFSERLFQTFSKNFGFDIRIARFHNIYGPLSTYSGGREKAPAAICRKIAEVVNGGEIEIFGDGEQTRSFLYIDDCLEGVERLMNSNHKTPINIGSEEMVSINEMARIVGEIAGKQFKLKHIDGPLGVRGRNSNNDLVKKVLGWDYQFTLKEGLSKTYSWISEMINDE